MRTLVTGGTGFIGGAVCKALAERCFVDVISRKIQPALPRPDVLVHLAWEGLPCYSPEMCARNILLARKVFDDVSSPHLKKVIAVGTCWEYGDRVGMVSEGDPVPDENLTPFLAAKRQVRIEGVERFGTRFIWVRPFFVYGPGQRATSLLPSVYAALRDGREPKIKTPCSAHDFIHVDDVADAIARLATMDVPGGVYNIGTGGPTTVSEAVSILATEMGAAGLHDRTGQGMWANTTKLRDATGWRRRFNLEDGIRQTVAAWRANGS